MARQFMVRQKDGRGVIGPFSAGRVHVIALARIVLGRGPFRIKLNGEFVSPPTPRRRTLIGLRNRMFHGGVGDVFRVVEPDARVAILVREVRPSVDVIDTNGNHKADACWTAVVREFEFPIYFLGSYVCRNVAGSSTRSQHSYGNAVDFGSDSMTYLHKIADWLVSRSTELSIEHVIVADQVWTRGYGWSHYSGEYHYHCHADFHPQFSAACGVRN